MTREQGRQWVDDTTIIQLNVDVSVIPTAEEAHKLFELLAVHAHEQIDLHYKMSPPQAHAFVEGQMTTNVSTAPAFAEGQMTTNISKEPQYADHDSRG